jgi:malonyl CoA-acyl carrier protein transacylase
MLAYLFPGQGSQFKGMGKGLFEQFPEIVETANQILGYSVESLCLEDPNEQLNQTQFTQPALFTVSALSFLKQQSQTASKPDYVLGHSLGEYTALFAANVFDFATGLRLVKKRGELMHTAKEGAMAAVIGLTENATIALLKEHSLNELCIANVNSYLQMVLSGSKKEMQQAQVIFEKQSKVTFIPLKVSGAFHSDAMRWAADEFDVYLNNVTFSLPSIPVLANLDAGFYHPQNTKQNLVNQISSTVQWVEMIRRLDKHSVRYEEIGPGNVLSGLVRRIHNNQ